MKTYEFKLPDIGEGVTEGEIVKWLVTPGESVKEDQPMVEIMTDKATVTITAPKSGKILETRGSEGSVVPVHSVLVVFDIGEGGGEEAAPIPDHGGGAAAKSGDPAATAVGDIKETLPGMNLVQATALAKANGGTKAGYFNAKPLATPATRRLARELGVDLRAVAPSGPHGRVTKDDVRGFGGASAAVLVAAAAAAARARAGTSSRCLMSAF
jgi:pyruvate dehydrogenase E2 component (dihydrolipoamide acetyltransferase)